MPNKMRSKPKELEYCYTTLEEAFGHYFDTWYEGLESGDQTIGDPHELYLAFLSGAHYLKALVVQLSKLTPAEAKTGMGTLYKELAAQLPAAREKALIASAFQTEPEGPPPAPEVPSEGMNLVPPAPGPGEEPPAPPPPPPAAPPPPPAANPAGAPSMQPMTWTYGMLQEFRAAHRAAVEAGEHAFPFRDHKFRVVDAPAIIKHLADVFKAEK